MSRALVPASAPAATLKRVDRSIVESFWQGKSPRTIKAYKEDLARIAAWASCDGVEALARHFLSLGSGGAYKFAHEFRGWASGEMKWSPSYVNNHLAALRSFVKFARRIEVIEWALDIEDVKLEAYRDTRGPGFEGLVKIIDAAAAQKDPWTATRDTAITMIFATMGLRLDELVTLDVEHVDLHGRRLRVKRKKKLQRVWVTAPEETMGAIVAWLVRRCGETVIEHVGAVPDLGRLVKILRAENASPLFTSRAFGRRRADGRLASSSVWALIRRLAASVGLKAWPHGLRHAAITEVLEITDGNIRAAQKFGGHASPVVTGKYDDNRTDIAGEMASKLAKAIAKARKK